jgi:diacylglycerol kinase family enzyme
VTPAADPTHAFVAAAADPTHAWVIASPLASRLGDADTRSRIIRATADALGDRGAGDVRIVETCDPAGLREAAEAAVAAGAGTVVLIGGDGTVRDTADALANTGVVVGLVPGGTGNLYATAVGVPRSIEAAIALLRTGRPQPVDIGEVRRLGSDGDPDPPPMAFVAACGTGLDGRLVAATTREMKQRYGVAAYFMAALGLLDHLDPQPTVLTLDGVRTELESVVVLVVNCSDAIPGVLRPRLPVRADDGLLHVFVLPKGGVIGGLVGAVELVTAPTTGTTPTGSGVRLAGTSVRVEVSPPGPTEVDGDPFPPAILEARVRPGVLRVIRPS